MLRVNEGVEAVEIKLIFKDKRKKQTITIKHPNINYSIQRDVTPLYSTFGPFGSPYAVETGPATVKFDIQGHVPGKKRRR